jgi:DNA-binding response OmpR family regulator
MDLALRGLTVLAVEDDFLLLAELEAVLHDAGADIVHGCRTIGEAIALLDQRTVSAAILDVRVGGDTIGPVARRLVRQKTPFFFYTGQTSSDRFISEWPRCAVVSKPAQPRVIIRTLADLLRHRPDLPRPNTSR